MLREANWPPPQDPILRRRNETEKNRQRRGGAKTVLLKTGQLASRYLLLMLAGNVAGACLKFGELGGS